MKFLCIFGHFLKKKSPRTPEGGIRPSLYGGFYYTTRLFYLKTASLIPPSGDLGGYKQLHMKRFKLLNNIFGWVAFAIAAATYLLTMEPTASFWDCGEFISTAFKMDVGHPPGAPFFMLMGRIFTMFAADTIKVAIMVNSLSALLSAFTILF